MKFYSGGSLKEQYAGIIVAPLGHIILISSRQVFDLSPWCCVLSGEATDTNVILCGLTPSGLDPTVYQWENVCWNFVVYIILWQFYIYFGPLWLYGSLIYNYMRNQCLSPLQLWIRIILHILLCTRNNVMWKKIQWLPTGRWFSPGIPFSSTNKTDRYDIIAILLKVALSTINLNHPYISMHEKFSRTVLLSGINLSDIFFYLCRSTILVQCVLSGI